MDSCGSGPGRGRYVADAELPFLVTLLISVGRSVNIPWPSSGRTDADYLLAMQSLVMPIAEEFAPELVISM